MANAPCFAIGLLRCSSGWHLAFAEKICSFLVLLLTAGKKQFSIQPKANCNFKIHSSEEREDEQDRRWCGVSRLPRAQCCAASTLADWRRRPSSAKPASACRKLGWLFDGEIVGTIMAPCGIGLERRTYRRAHSLVRTLSILVHLGHDFISKLPPRIQEIAPELAGVCLMAVVLGFSGGR